MLAVVYGASNATGKGSQAPHLAMSVRIIANGKACHTERSGVNPRTPRPVKRAPVGGEVIATPAWHITAGPETECSRRGVHYDLREDRH
jgi:hypothetical protein